MHAVETVIPTTAQPMSPFEHTDPTFAPDAPALPSAEPALVFIRAPRRRLGAAPMQDHASDTAVGGGLFVGRRGESAIAGGQIRRAAKDRLMAIQRRRPQGDVGRSRRMYFVGGDDLMFGLLNRHERAEFGGLGNLALPDRPGVGFEDAEHLVGHVRVPAQYPRSCLREHPLDEWPYLLQVP